MTEAERTEAIRALAGFFLELRETEADNFLRSARATSITPSGWGGASAAARRSQIRMVLAGQSEPVIEALCMAADVDVAAPVALPKRPDSAGRRPEADEPKRDRPAVSTGPIFVVHGHDHRVLHVAARVIERGTGRDATVLHEQADSGRTILEKFEDHAETAAYAVVLLTADDVGGANGGSARPRARQNVIFELGFFFGTLGRRRVAVLVEGGVERPSDIDGLVYIELDAAGTWKHRLLREIAAAGLDVDFTRIP